MMTIKNYIKKLIGQGKSDIGVDCALSELENLDEQTKNSLILAKARFSDLVDKLNNRTINNEDFEVNKSQINSSILFILDNLDKEYNAVEVTSEIIKKYQLKKIPNTNKINWQVWVSIISVIGVVISLLAYLNDINILSPSNNHLEKLQNNQKIDNKPIEQPQEKKLEKETNKPKIAPIYNTNPIKNDKIEPTKSNINKVTLVITLKDNITGVLIKNASIIISGSDEVISTNERGEFNIPKETIEMYGAINMVKVHLVKEGYTQDISIALSESYTLKINKVQ